MNKAVFTSGFRMRRSGRFLTGTALISGIIVFTSAAAFAQTAGGATAASGQLEDVVVTGSLISSPNYVAASPIVTMSAEDLKASGQVNVEATLDQLPDFSPAGTAATGGQGTGGHATLNLHGLGSQRNLVLLDGRRLPFADISGDVDINFIPQAILSGVDVITGGASAVYGSDAMSGVVNFKTLSQFEGLKADVQYGNSFKSDYTTVSSSLTAGTSFAGGKGHALLSLSYTYREGLSGAKRSFYQFVTPSGYIGQGLYVPSAANLPSQAAVNTLFAGYGVAKTIPNSGNFGFNDDGTLFQQNGAANYKGPTTNGYAVLGGNVRMPVGPQTDIVNPLDQRSAFGKFDYKVTPNITAYGQALFVDSDVYTTSGGSLTQFAVPTIPATNPFIPHDLATLLASRPTPNAPFTWNARYVGVPHKAWDEHYFVSQIIGGARGDFSFRDWTWDAYASYATTDHLQSNYNAVLASNVQTLLNAPDGGASICAGGFNPFGLVHSTNLSQACQNYITTTAHSTEHISQTVVQGKAQGSLFSLPAGDVELALVTDYRRDTYKYSPDSQLAAGNIEAVISSQPAQGAIGVTEVAGQLDVPLLANVALAHKLDVGAAYRYSDYTTSGGTSTYEGNVKWWPFESLLLRGSYQRAIRAPNIGELYSAAAGGQTAFGTPPGGGEPCDSRLTRSAQLQALCVATGVPAGIIGSYIFPTTAAASLTSGNPNLTPEKANTYNLGFAYNPDFSSPLFSDLSLSLDYYNIAIKNVISVVPGTTALSKCYNLDGSNPSYSASNYFCSLISRDPSNGQLVQIRTPYENLGGLKTDGIDLQVNWSAGLGAFGLDDEDGRVFADTGIGYTRAYSVETLPNTSYQNYIGTNTIGAPHPIWKALTTIGYDFGVGTVSLRWHYLDAMKDISAVTNPAHAAVGVPAYNLFDLIGTYDVGHDWVLRAGITNMFNKGIPLVASSQTSTDPATYDVVGRSYYLGLGVNF